MTENTRTVTYIGVAVALLVVAAVVNRKPVVESEFAAVDKVLFPELKSPGDVAGLQIETLGADNRLREFKVVRGEAGWSLPSHGDYPADAEQQVASAAASLIDLRALGVVSTLPSEHGTYGVIAPDPEKAPPGAEGVGKLVTVLDKSGKSLARLVLGNEDKPSDESAGGGGLRFVRALPHDIVYRVALPSAKFTTNFADWIETDLLKMDPWNVAEVTLKDYAVDADPDFTTGALQVVQDQKSTIKLDFNDQDSKWSLEELVVYENGDPQPIELGMDEELNTVRLNELKTALDELKIVDVRPKPASMSKNLKDEKSIFRDPKAMQSLVERGFYPVPGKEGQPEILSGNGEVTVRMKDGLEYLLRFGEVAGIGSEEKKEEPKADETAGAKSVDDKDDTGAGLNRYIMVSARFNKELIPEPALEPVPEGSDTKKSETKTDAQPDANGDVPTATPESATPEPATPEPAAKSEKSEPADSAGEDAKSAGEDAKSAGEPKADAVKQSSDDKSAAVQRDGALHFVKFQDDAAGAAKAKADKSGSKSPKADAGKSADAVKKAAATKQADKKADEAKKENEADGSAPKGDDGKKSDETKEDDAAAGEDDGKQPLSAGAKEDRALERIRIEKENERKQKEYDEKIKNGEAQARELNARFADWYYVVSESTYRKIHLNRDDVIKKKADESKTGSDTSETDPSGAGIEADPLVVPDLKVDPFQKRDAAKEQEEPKNDE